MKVAVTGASGFVGGHVLSALLAADQAPELEIVAVSRGGRDWPAGVRHVAFDLHAADASAFDRLGRPDILIHLAWGGLPNYLSVHHFAEELPAHYRFLEAMVKGGLPAMLVTGTCYEYGMVDGALSEDRAPAPANPYAHAKAALQAQLGFLQAHHPFALTWARLFYMWGEGQAAGSIHPLLQSAIARGDPFFPMSGGEQLRDYLPVAEVARALVDLALAGCGQGIVNVSSGQPVAIRTLVERWIAESGAAIVPDLGRFPYPGYEPLAFWGTATKRRALTGRSG